MEIIWAPWSCDQPPSVTTAISTALVRSSRITTARVALDSVLSRLGWCRTVSAIARHNTLRPAIKCRFCGRAGTGRQSRFRSWWPRGRGGSSPSARIDEVRERRSSVRARARRAHLVRSSSCTWPSRSCWASGWRKRPDLVGTLREQLADERAEFEEVGAGEHVDVAGLPDREGVGPPGEAAGLAEANARRLRVEAGHPSLHVGTEAGERVVDRRLLFTAEADRVVATVRHRSGVDDLAVHVRAVLQAGEARARFAHGEGRARVEVDR